MWTIRKENILKMKEENGENLRRTKRRGKKMKEKRGKNPMEIFKDNLL